MSKEKINKTDIQNAVTNAFLDTIHECRQTLTANQVAKVFEGSGLLYHFDSESANITILVDGNSRIECVHRNGVYEIRPLMTYNSMTPIYRSLFGNVYRFDSYQLPSMIGFFRNFANKLITIKKEFDSQTKNIIVGDVLKTMIKPLLRKEKIYKVKYRIGDDGGGLIMYKDFFDTLRLSATLTSDNYESRISEFGEANRAMSDIVDRDDAATFVGIISGVERNKKIKLVNPCTKQKPYATEMRYPKGIKLLDFAHIEDIKEEYADLCRLLDDLKYNWGWIPKNSNQCYDRVIVQINNNLLFLITINDCYSYRKGTYEIEFVPEIKYHGMKCWLNFDKSYVFDFLNILATQVPDDELAELSFSDDVVFKAISMIADRTLTIPHNCIISPNHSFYAVIYMGTKEKDCLLRFHIERDDVFAAFNNLNENYEDYLNLVSIIVKYPEYIEVLED